MGQKTVRFSDLSGQLITEEDALARIVVHEHPELGDSPVEFEALTDEAMVIEKAALRVAVVELHLPGEDAPRRVTMEAEAFDRLATDKPMSELLVTARPVRPARRPARSAPADAGRGVRVDYATLEHAGEPHKGKITDAEKQLVRDHFEEINDRLVAQGLRTISLTDPEHVERYGLEELAGKQQAGRDVGQLPGLSAVRGEGLPAAGGEGLPTAGENGLTAARGEGLPAAGGDGLPAARENGLPVDEDDLPVDTDDLTAEEMDLAADEVDPPLDADDLPEVQVASRGRGRGRRR
ncbi:MAG TPA: hypothetical protein VE733_01820 [Streptosporangiaceae bacterium]|nr:hypothetical protein [Streptosporangiaceae bacterium]